MDIGTILSVANNVTTSLQCYELTQNFLNLGFESELHEFKRTVETLCAVLRDAESKQELTHEIKTKIEQIKTAFYEADDLLDEFVTVARLQRLIDADGTLFEKLRNFFSPSNPICVSYWMSRGIKDIKKKLDAIAYNQQFSLNIDHEPIRKRNRETCSYVNDEFPIIGREKELEHIVDMLLSSNVQQQNMSNFFSIVGIGGLGKTALSQLIYNDPRITTAFQLRMWTCIADQDQKQFDVTEVLRKILASATGQNSDQGSTLDWVQFQLREKLAAKKYLLVLDDVWTEDRVQWRELEKYLVTGQEGSWFLVTTRSKRTATIVGDGRMHMLQGLSVKNSQKLFRSVAFGSDVSNPPENLVDIGREIVDKCAGVPLAIKMMGSLLYGQDTSKWELVQKLELANIMEIEDNVMSILKLSYHHLEYPLQSCFSYCAIFPKDYEILKENLKNLWIAQGYIVPLYTGQSIEDASEDYFLTLLKRCFFQDIRRDRAGEILSVKLHDLIHDIAQSVSNNLIYAEETINGNLDTNVCLHLSTSRILEFGKFFVGKTRLRTYVCGYSTDDEVLKFQHLVKKTRLLANISRGLSTSYTTKCVDNCEGKMCSQSCLCVSCKNDKLVDVNNLEALVKSCGYLRVLVMPDLGIKTLPESISKLLHLRYLDLSCNTKLEVLPMSIAKLYNLETLNLRFCDNLKELPKDLSKMVKLRVLKIRYCDRLEYMPKGMNKLSSLNILDTFIVGGEGNCSSWNEWFYGIEELKVLNNLRLKLRIIIKWPKSVEQFAQEVGERKGLYLVNKKYLNEIEICFEDVGSDRRIYGKELMKLMEDLHPPSSLRFLVVDTYPGKRMSEWISLLTNLVTLSLVGCKNLEYVETFGTAEQNIFLPCLEKLELRNLPKLKGWSRGGVVIQMEDSSNSHLQLLPCLKELKIFLCKKLTYFPLCPMVEILYLKHFNERLRGIISEDIVVLGSPKLRELGIDEVTWLNSFSIEVFRCLEKLDIEVDMEVDDLGEVVNVLRSCRSSLRFLKISGCCKEKLSEQETESEEGSAMIMTSLHTLELTYLPKMVNLPSWMQFLPALNTLEINSCEGLKSMPNWMPKLTNLTQLHVRWCSKSLEERCKQDPQGEDWPYVQHIPNILFRDCSDQQH